MTQPSTVLVSLSDWEIQCCVPGPELGDTVSWPLMMWVPRGQDRDQRPDPPEPAAERRWWRVQRWDDATTVLVDGPISAFWADHGASPPDPGVAEVEGLLIATLHWPPVPTGLSEVSGRVSRLWVTHHRYRSRTGSNGRSFLVPVPGSTTLREVARSPDWSDHDDTGGGTGKDTSKEAGSDPGAGRADGLLIELTVLNPHI